MLLSLSHGFYSPVSGTCHTHFPHSIRRPAGVQLLKKIFHEVRSSVAYYECLWRKKTSLSSSKARFADSVIINPPLRLAEAVRLQYRRRHILLCGKMMPTFGT